MIPGLIYLLCAIASVMCAVLLLRKHQNSRVRLLFWSGLCFAGLALNNILLFLDLVLIPDMDLSIVRTIPALVGVTVLIWGFIWDHA